MRLLITTSIYPPDIGGPATYCRMLKGSLSRGGHDVTVLTGSRTSKADGDVIRIRRTRPFFWMNSFANLARLNGRFDVLLAAGLFDSVALAWNGPWIAKIPGDEAWERSRRFGWTRDDIDLFQRRRYGARIERLKQLRTRWLQSADFVVAPSQYLADLAAGWGLDRDRIRVIHNAVESSDRATERHSGPMRIVAAGRFVPHKRFEELIEVISKVDGATLEIVGEGPEETALQAAIQRHKVVDRCRVSPPAPLDEKLRTADVFVQNSSYEGFPHSLLEAMAAGLAVVASGVGGTPEAVGDAGLLIDSRVGLEAALTRVVNEPGLRRDLGRRARERARSFSLDAMTASTESLLHQVVRGRS